jgi:hypothetical protein
MNISIKVLLLISLTSLFFISINTKNANKLKKVKISQAQPVEGERIKLENSKLSFVIPKDWKHDWNANTNEMIILPPKISPPMEFVKMTERALEEDEKNLNINDILLKEKESILKMSPIPIVLTTVLGPEEIKLENLKAGRYVANANPFGVLLYEGYMGAVKDEENNKVLYLYAAYMKNKSDAIRPGLDMIMKSINKN